MRPSGIRATTGQSFRSDADTVSDHIDDAVFTDREVMVPLARETAWHVPQDPLMGWRDG
jgi:hypothetical protein